MASASDFSYRKAIEIDYNKVVATLTDFPVLISITDTDLMDDAQDDGDDIAFFLGTTQLAHEVESFKGTTGELQAWVNVPTLSSDTSTTIYMYYGNATCESQENVAGVWDSNFKMVQHLNETTGTHYDSTGNDNGGTPYGVTQTAIGQIDGADDFDGMNDYVNCGNRASLNITGDITIEAWVKPEIKQTNPPYGVFVIKGRETTHKTNYAIRQDVTGKKFDFYYRISGNDNWQVYRSSNDQFSDNVWRHVAVTYTFGTGNSLKMYVDGEEITGSWIYGNGNADPAITTESLRIGTGVLVEQYKGTLDEVRISDTARSADWIETSYNNQNDPSSFITVGDEQTTDPGIPEFPTMSLPALIVIAAVFLMYRRKQRQ